MLMDANQKQDKENIYTENKTNPEPSSLRTEEVYQRGLGSIVH